jgi:iron complex outermembrane receptor protein
LQDVPISVSVVDEDQMRNAGIESIQDVKMLVPTLNIYTTGMPTRTSIKIRGAGTYAADPSLEPSVGVFVDGVYMRALFSA